MKRIFIIVLSVLLSVSILSSETVTAKATPKISKTKLTLSVGNKKKLTVTGAKVVKWKSSNKKIVAVTSKGVITAAAKGKATITAKLRSGKKLKCSLTVKSAFVLPANPKEIIKYTKKCIDDLEMFWSEPLTPKNCSWDTPGHLSSFDYEREVKAVILSQLKKVKRIQERNGYEPGEFHVKLYMKKIKNYYGKRDFLLYFLMG